MITTSSTLTISSGVYTVTDDITYTGSGNAIEITGSNVYLDLNGHTIYNYNNAQNGVYANNQSFVTVANGTIYGFQYGIELLDYAAHWNNSFSQTNNHILNMDITGQSTGGFIIEGNYAYVEDTNIWNVGGSNGTGLERVYAAKFYGPNATYNYSSIYNIFGGSESIGISFSQGHTWGVPNRVYNVTLDGYNAYNQSFGIWTDSQDTLQIFNSYIHDWDYAAGGTASATYDWSTFAYNANDFGYLNGGATANPVHGASVFTPLSGYTTGNARSPAMRPLTGYTAARATIS